MTRFTWPSRSCIPAHPPCKIFRKFILTPVRECDNIIERSSETGATLCRSGGIGRRPGLKIPWEQSRAGSTPVSGTTYRGIEQLVARRAHNPEVGGSSPPPATRNPLESPDFSGLFLFLATFPRGLFFALKFDPDFDPYGEKVRSRRAFLCLDLTAFLGRFLRFRELLSIPVPWPWPPPFAPPWSRGHRYPR